MEVKANTISFGFSVRSDFFENKKTTSRSRTYENRFFEEFICAFWLFSSRSARNVHTKTAFFEKLYVRKGFLRLFSMKMHV